MTETPLINLPTEIAELQAVKAEAIGWLPLGEGAYLHVGYPDKKEAVGNAPGIVELTEVVDVVDIVVIVDIVDVVGVPDASMAGMTVLLLAW